MTRPPLPDAIVAARVIAVARKIAPGDLTTVAEALRVGGLGVIEVTLDGEGALDSIRTLAAGPHDVGAGTVMSVAAAEAAVDAGAGFIVSPHTDAAIVSWAVQRGIPVLPGAFTPTEVVSAWHLGASAVKVFPASLGGPGLLRALGGPLGEVLMVPTGGIDAANAGAFIGAGAVAVGVGGWLTAQSDPGEITRRARALVSACAPKVV